MSRIQVAIDTALPRSSMRFTLNPGDRTRGMCLVVLLCWFSVGSTALGHGDTHEKIEVLDAVLEQNPDDVASLLERAELNRRHRNYEEALVDLDRVRLLSPTSNMVDYLTGLTLLELGKLNEAETVLQLFISRLPSSTRGHLALAKVFTLQKRYLNAAQAYELVIKNQSVPIPDHFLARAQAYMAAGKPHLSQALNGLEEGIESIGPLITFQRLAVEIEIAQGNHQGAIDRIDKILRDVDRKETWLVKQARVLALNGQTEEARVRFLRAQKAIDILPQRTKTSPAVLALSKTIDTFLKHESPEEEIDHEPPPFKR